MLGAKGINRLTVYRRSTMVGNLEDFQTQGVREVHRGGNDGCQWTMIGMGKTQWQSFVESQ